MNERLGQFLLINIRKSAGNVYLPPQEMMGPSLICEYLQDHGTNIQELPKERTEWDKFIPTIIYDVEQIPDISIIGFSIATQTFDIFKTLLSELKQRYKDIMFIAGGPHFCIPDTANKALMSTEIDAVVVGHSGEFFEFFSKNQKYFDPFHKSKLLNSKLPRGLYISLDKRVYGQGFGKNIPLTESGTAIHYKRNEASYICLLSSEICPNNCDYCFSTRIYNSNHFEKEIYTIKKILMHSKKVVIDIFDNASIAAKSTKVFDILEKAGAPNSKKEIELVAYLDLADLVTPDWALFRKFLTYGGRYIYIGRDTVSENVAKKIGRKYKNKVRTQKLLNSEKVALYKLFDILRNRNSNITVSIDYIFSPWMTFKEVTLQLEEMKELTSIESEMFQISVEFQILCPFPGTKIYAEETGNFVPLEVAPYDLVDYWFLDGSPGKTFLKLVDLLIYPNNFLNGSNILLNSNLLSVAALLAYGKGTDASKEWCKQYLKFCKTIESFNDFMKVFENKLRYIDHFDENDIKSMVEFEQPRLKILFKDSD